jgi:hypothetical protein
MRNRIGTLLVLVAVSLVSWIFLSVGSGETEEKTLRMQVTCDSLSRANREHELHIMQLEYDVEALSDALSDCTEDFQNCIAGRKIQIRHIDGSILTGNPEY